MRKPPAMLLAFGLAAGLLAACGGSATTEPASASGGVTSTQAEAPTQVLSAEQRVPEDIPIPEGASNLQVDSRGKTFTFSVAMPVPELIDYFVTELTALGWETTGGSESMIGLGGTVVRRKGADRVTVTMNGNPNTDDVFVQINLAR